MFCGHCGNQLNDNIAFCPHCGAKVNDLTPQNNQTNHFDNYLPLDYQSNTYNNPNPQGNQPNIYENPVATTAGTAATRSALSKIILIVSILIGASVIIGGGLFIKNTFFDNPDDVAEEYVKAVEKMDLEKCFKLTPYDVDEIFDDIFAGVIEKEDSEVNNASDVLAYYTKLMQNAMEKQNISFSIEITDKEKLSEKQLKKKLKEYDENFPGGLSLFDYIDKDKLGKAYLYSVDSDIDGENISDDLKQLDSDFIVVKYDGDWKVISNSALPDL